MSKYESLASDIGRLVDEKNAAYGNAHAKSGEFLRILWPSGVPVEAYRLALTFVRMFDKFMRMAHNPTAFGEDPAKDLVGYSLLLAGATGSQYLKFIHDTSCAVATDLYAVCTCDPSREA